jgi:hypothetical protein
MEFAHLALTVLGFFVLAVVVVVAFVDWRLERNHESVGQALAWWSGRHPVFVIGLVFFYGFLLAHLFTSTNP